MVSTYMYPAGANNAQTAPQGQAVPTTNPAYSSYQPTPTQGYQASYPSTPLSFPQNQRIESPHVDKGWVCEYSLPYLVGRKFLVSPKFSSVSGSLSKLERA